MKSKMAFLAAAVLLIAAIAPVRAAVVYNYSGNNYTTIVDDPTLLGAYSTNERVTGSFTLANPLAANLNLALFTAPSFIDASFSDGRSTLNLGQLQLFRISTDAAGNITAWSISFNSGSAIVLAGQQQEFIQTANFGSTVIDDALVRQCTITALSCLASSTSPPLLDLAQVTEDPGEWSVTPLPAALPLFASGLGALGLLGWRRKRKAAALAA
jgi:hypothetical protein